MNLKHARIALLGFDTVLAYCKTNLERLGVGCADIYDDSSALPVSSLYDIYIVDDFFTAGELQTAWVPHIEFIRSFYPNAKMLLMSMFSSDEAVAKQYAIEFLDYADSNLHFNERIQKLWKAVDVETTHTTVGFDNCSIYWRPLNDEETKCLFGILDYNGPRLEEVFDREPPMFRDDGQHIGDFLKLLWERWIAKLTEQPIAKNLLPIPIEQFISIANFYSVTDLESTLSPELKELYL